MGGRWLPTAALLTLSLVLFAAAFAANFAVKQR